VGGGVVLHDFIPLCAAQRATRTAKIDYCTDYDLGEAYENLLNKNVLNIIE
jgi:hypothetical protein